MDYLPLLPRINKVKCKLIQLTLKKQQNLQVWGSPTVEGEYLLQMFPENYVSIGN